MSVRRQLSLYTGKTAHRRHSRRHVLRQVQPFIIPFLPAVCRNAAAGFFGATGSRHKTDTIWTFPTPCVYGILTRVPARFPFERAGGCVSFSTQERRPIPHMQYNTPQQERRPTRMDPATPTVPRPHKDYTPKKRKSQLQKVLPLLLLLLFFIWNTPRPLLNDLFSQPVHEVGTSAFIAEIMAAYTSELDLAQWF